MDPLEVLSNIQIDIILFVSNSPIEDDRMFPNPFYAASIIMILKPDKENVQKRKL